MAIVDGKWRVSEIAYADLPQEAVVTIDIADGVMSGKAACATYRAELNIAGDHLHKGPIERNSRDCDIELEEAEANFIRVLEVVDRFEVDGDGNLTLLAQQRPMIRAVLRDDDPGDSAD